VSRRATMGCPLFTKTCKWIIDRMIPTCISLSSELQVELKRKL
jgi:hypothetical protein